MLAFAFASAGVYAAVLRSGRGLDRLAIAQLLVDQATWTVLVYLTGGATSGATSFYGLTCVTGAALAGLRGAAIAAISGGALYVGLVSCWLVAGFRRRQINPPLCILCPEARSLTTCSSRS